MEDVEGQDARHERRYRLKEQFEPDRMILMFEPGPEQAIKTSDKKQAIKTIEHKEKIREYLLKEGPSKARDLAEYLKLSTVRTRAILVEMEDVERQGTKRDRRYRLKGCR